MSKWNLDFTEHESIFIFDLLGVAASKIEEAARNNDVEKMRKIANTIKLVCAKEVYRQVEESNDEITQCIPFHIYECLTRQEKEELLSDDADLTD